MTGASVAPTWTARPGLLAVEVGEAGHWLRVEELEQELVVLPDGLAGVDALPVAALVAAEVEHLERPAAGDVEEALAGGVDGEAAEVGGDPSATEPFCCYGRGPGSDVCIEDEVTRVGCRRDDAV